MDVVGSFESTAACSSVGMPVFGQVTVTEPVSEQGQMSKYTTYLVEGCLGSQHFSARKRYSDFEWLRKVLAVHIPGIMLPALPVKQYRQRFGSEFIEGRRVGLENFLRRLLRRERTARTAPLLVRFLSASSAELEEVKKEIDGRTLKEIRNEFNVMFAHELESCKPPSDDTKFADARVFLKSHIAQLQQSIVAVAKLCQTHENMMLAASAAHTRLSVLFRVSFPSESHGEGILKVLDEHNSICNESPSGHFEVVLASLQDELSEAQSLEEAIESLVSTLPRRLVDVRKRVTAFKAEKARLLRKGQTDTSEYFNLDPDDMPKRQRKRDKLFNVLEVFQSKNRTMQLANVQWWLEKHIEEVSCGEELINMARTVCASYEMPAYASMKLGTFRTSFEQMADRKAGTSKRLADVWSTAAPKSGQSMSSAASCV